MKITRPILRYHGGKWRLAPWIVSHFPNHKIYVEPYGGGASVLLRKSISYAEIYNDIDEEVVNLFRVVRDRGNELAEKLRLTPFSRIEFYTAYLNCHDPLEKARRTVVKSFMGYSSGIFARNGKSEGFRVIKNARTGFRSNSNRSGTIPAHDWANYPQALDAIIKRLRPVVIENRDAMDVVLQHDGEQTLHYIDPPYLKSTRGDMADDYRHEMTEQDHVDMARILHEVKGMVIVSGYPSKLYDELFKGWKSISKEALADGARKRTEVLWFSPNIDRTGLFE